MELLSKATVAMALFLTVSASIFAQPKTSDRDQRENDLAPQPVRRTSNTSTGLRCKPWWTRPPANC